MRCLITAGISTRDPHTVNYPSVLCEVLRERLVLHLAQCCEDSGGDREVLSGQGSALLMPITTDIVISRYCTEAGAVR